MNALRLAYNPGPINAYRALEPARVKQDPTLWLSLSGVHSTDKQNALRDEYDQAPSLRLALGNSPPKRNATSGLEAPKSQTGANSADHLAMQIPSPTVRLAHKVNGQGDNCLGGDKGVQQLPKSNAPALLVSYIYLAPFLKNRLRYHYRDWVLDSGAFSAHASGTKIDLQAYIDKATELLATDATLSEVYSLDVIGDWKATVKNTEEMWRQGIRAIPCYHVGSPETLLQSLAKDYPKIALGGAVGYRGKDAWAQQCFARVWPCRIHGFGFGGQKSILALPWHSVDATNWEIGPCKFGRWQSFGQLSVRGSQQNLRAEVQFYLNLEQQARVKWRKQMAELVSPSEKEGGALRLAFTGHGSSRQRREGENSFRRLTSSNESHFDSV